MKKTMNSDWQIVSKTHGRLRVRVHPKRKTTELMEEVKNHLKDQPGIQQIDINTITGSVLIYYDKHTHSHSDVLAMLHDIGVILHDIVEGGNGLPIMEHSTTATQISTAIGDLDRHVYHITGGRANLKLIVPLLMGVLGFHQIIKKGWGLSEIPGYVLLWYAFDAFYKFHHGSQTPEAASQ